MALNFGTFNPSIDFANNPNYTNKGQMDNAK